MKYTLRSYQQESSDKAVEFLLSDKEGNGIVVLPTGSGKSLVIADIVSKLNGKIIIFQPSKEILEQNYAKYLSYGGDAGIYSASLGSKEKKDVVFATIGSVQNTLKEFDEYKYVIIDECHKVNAKKGMYKKFLKRGNRRTVGLTATPYRLEQKRLRDVVVSSRLEFLTSSKPRFFTDILYVCQPKELLEKGYLAKLRYFDMPLIDVSRLRVNSTGADYREDSLRMEYERVDFPQHLYNITQRVLRPKDGIPRKGILIFTAFVEESENLVERLIRCGVNAAMVTGTTPAKNRTQILEKFKKGEIKVVANVGTLTTGFDHPALDTVIIARPTRSLALYYQIVGRAIRPHNDKEGWIIDLCGTYKRFGSVTDLEVRQDTKEWNVYNGFNRQLTNIDL